MVHVFGKFQAYFFNYHMQGVKKARFKILFGCYVDIKTIFFPNFWSKVRANWSYVNTPKIHAKPFRDGVRKFQAVTAVFYNMRIFYFIVFKYPLFLLTTFFLLSEEHIIIIF